MLNGVGKLSSVFTTNVKPTLSQNQGWENGVFWCLLVFILNFGRSGGCAPLYFIEKLAYKVNRMSIVRRGFQLFIFRKNSNATCNMNRRLIREELLKDYEHLKNGYVGYCRK